jgi:hypothetical protein
MTRTLEIIGGGAAVVKTCTGCGHTKTLTQFYRHNRYRDGRRNQCRICVMAYNARNKVHFNALHREGKKRRGDKDWKKYPLRTRARNRLAHAVRRGLVKKLPCERCGRVDSQAHHQDYSKPLDVVWLCPVCHGWEHMNHG